MKQKMRKIEFVDKEGNSIGNILSVFDHLGEMFVLTDNGIWVEDKTRQSATERINEIFFKPKLEYKDK